MVITKKELMKQIAEKTQSTGIMHKVKLYVDAVFDCVKEDLANGDEVSIRDFGTFKVTECNERKGRNPQTGEEIIIAAHKKPHFKPSGTFKDAVN